MGWTWVGLMAIVAVSSLSIHRIKLVGIWSPIHLLSILVIAQLPFAVLAARRRNIGAHRKGMIGLFTRALVLAGLFTLLPGRIIGRMIFA